MPMVWSQRINVNEEFRKMLIRIFGSYFKVLSHNAFRMTQKGMLKKIFEYFKRKLQTSVNGLYLNSKMAFTEIINGLIWVFHFKLLIKS